ncbi:MAG TPA: ribosome maturation factor RimM [Bryobacteraceae bacterium]|nr:ribosome maturation factor RimM [Bryobacteraceae bacterium]
MDEWSTLAHIVRPRGLRGEVIAEAGGFTPEQMLEFPTITLRPPGIEVKLEAAWPHQGRMVLKIAGIDGVEAAEALRGAELTIPRQDRPPAPEGEVYFSDLIGCRVIEKDSGLELGVVADCLEYGGPMLLQVKQGDGELLIPFVSAICQQVDIAGKQILVVLPEGLKEL